MAWEQTFDEEIADFDALSATWDGYNGCETEASPYGFDSVVDTGSSMARAAAAVHDGTYGIEIAFDDDTVAYGVLDADAVDQTSGIASLWLDPNAVGLESGKIIDIFRAYDGTPDTAWFCRLAYTSGTGYTLSAWAREDGGGYVSDDTAVVTDAYHKLTYMFKRSSADGADDGWVRLYVDDVLAASLAGLDNDTKDWDVGWFGMCGTTSTTFSGSFYMDNIRIDPVGTPFIDKLAVKNGTYGLAVQIMDTTAQYADFTDPTAETTVTAECWFDPHTLTMADNDEFFLVEAPSIAFAIIVNKSGSDYRIRGAIKNDSAAYPTTSSYAITDEPHHLRTVWAASTGVGNDDGYLYLYIDSVLKETLTGLDNDTLTAGTVRFGATSGLDAGTYGILYMDDCQWSDDIYLVDLQCAVGTIAVYDKYAYGTAPSAAAVGMAAQWTSTLWHMSLGFIARWHDYFFTAPQHFDIADNSIQLTAPHHDYTFTAPKRKLYG